MIDREQLSPMATPSQLLARAQTPIGVTLACSNSRHPCPAVVYGAYLRERSEQLLGAEAVAILATFAPKPSNLTCPLALTLTTRSTGFFGRSANTTTLEWPLHLSRSHF